jgi:two-component system nitrate/nitrite sensor histidine kinase NarX
LNNPRFNIASTEPAPVPRELEMNLFPVEPDKPLETLLNGFLKTILAMTGAHAGAIRLLASDDAELYLGASTGLPPEIVRNESHVSLHCGICGTSVQDGKIHSSDTAHCAQHTEGPFFGSACLGLVAVPLDFRGQNVGVLNLFFDKKHDLSADESQLLRSYAELIGLSLENARLSRENQRMNLIAERQAIANEIHDTLSQNLFYGRLRMSVLSEAVRAGNTELVQKCLGDISEALDSGQKSVRELITHFRSQMDPLGLHHALKMLIDGLKVRSSISFDYSHPVTHPELTLEQELQVFHVVREALNNIVLHSKATQARLLATHEADNLKFQITDNGMGMSSIASPAGHYGLTIMQERARRIGATLDIHSAEGVGTQITLSLSASPTEPS